MKKSTLFVFGLVVVFGLLYVLSKENQVSVGVKKIKLPTFVSTKIDRILITGQPKDRITLEKKGEAWSLILGDKDNPREVKADQSNVEALLDAAQGVRHSHYVTNIKDKHNELGFAEDLAVVVTLLSNKSPVWELVLGKTAGGSGRYAKQKGDDDIYVVRGSFWQLTRNGADDFRDREILSIKEADLKTFKIEKDNESRIALVKGDNDQWEFDQSQKLAAGFRVDKEALSSLVRTVINLRADAFVDEKKPLASPLLTLHIGATDQTHTLKIYPSANDRYLVKEEGNEQIYEVTNYHFERLNKPIDQFRDLTLLHFDKNSIVSISLAHQKNRVVVNKKDNQWHITSPTKLPEDFQFDPSGVEDMLTLLSGLTALRVAGPKDMAQNPHWQKNWLVELTSDQGQKVHMFVGKTKNADEFLVRGNIDATAYLIKSSRLSSLNSGADAFKKVEFEMPPIDERTKGFESLPVDIQRKLLNATKAKK